ncbi:MAG: peroxiredoxin family protein [Anaerolineales bacterium]
MNAAPASRTRAEGSGRSAALVAVALLAVGCSSRPQSTPQSVEELVEADSDAAQEAAAARDLATETGLLSPTSPPLEPTPEPTVVPAQPSEIPAAQTPEAAGPAEIGVFAEMRDNLASGELAPDFEIRALGHSTFRLSAQRGVYVLVVPTAIGCGECVFTMNQLAAAYPDYRDDNLKLVLINLYPEDVPESWNSYVAAYPDLDAIWGVVSSIDFVIDYDIRSLGTILLVDPEGRVVFRSDYPLIEDELRQLLGLATS